CPARAVTTALMRLNQDQFSSLSSTRRARKPDVSRKPRMPATTANRSAARTSGPNETAAISETPDHRRRLGQEFGRHLTNEAGSCDFPGVAIEKYHRRWTGDAELLH